MLEFIVLGQIPGTPWQLNVLTTLLLAILVFIAIYLIVTYFRMRYFLGPFAYNIFYVQLIADRTIRIRSSR